MPKITGDFCYAVSLFGALNPISDTKDCANFEAWLTRASAKAISYRSLASADPAACSARA